MTRCCMFVCALVENKEKKKKKDQRTKPKNTPKLQKDKGSKGEKDIRDKGTRNLTAKIILKMGRKEQENNSKIARN